VLVLVDLGIRCNVVKVRDPVGLVGITGEGILGDQQVGVIELVIDVPTARQREASFRM